MSQAPERPYGMLIVVDGVLLAPDLQGGLVAFDGKGLGEVPDCGRFDRFHLWGDRLLLSDAANDRQAAWRVYDLNIERPAALGAGVLASENHRIRGDEMPAYEVFADGFVFIREWREGWGGGLFCYDLRIDKSLK